MLCFVGVVSAVSDLHETTNYLFHELVFSHELLSLETFTRQQLLKAELKCNFCCWCLCGSCWCHWTFLTFFFLSFFSEEVYILIARHTLRCVFMFSIRLFCPTPHLTALAWHKSSVLLPALHSAWDAGICQPPLGNNSFVAQPCPTEHEAKVIPLQPYCSPSLYLLALLHAINPFSADPGQSFPAWTPADPMDCQQHVWLLGLSPCTAGCMHLNITLKDSQWS